MLDFWFAKSRTTFPVVSSKVMKKLPKYLSLIVFSMMIWGAFSVPQANAFVYSQLFGGTDTAIASTSYQLVGDFVPAASNTYLTNVDYAQGSFSTRNTANASQPVIVISNTPPPTSSPNAIGYFIASTTLLGNVSTFVVLPLHAQSGFTLNAGTQYYIYFTTSLGGNGTGSEIATDAFSRFYGFISESANASGGFSLGATIFPGGISTSSAAIECGANFSTSTGFLDTVGQSFSLALCNVGVFLFVPSTNSLQQWQGFASTTRGKIPFSYYYDFQGILNGSSASTTDNFQGLSIDLASVYASTTPLAAVIIPSHIDLLSTTTVSKYVSSGMHTTLMFLASSAIWVMVLMHLYRRIRPAHAKI